MSYHVCRGHVNTSVRPRSAWQGLGFDLDGLTYGICRLSMAALQGWVREGCLGLGRLPGGPCIGGGNASHVHSVWQPLAHVHVYIDCQAVAALAECAFLPKGCWSCAAAWLKLSLPGLHSRCKRSSGTYRPC